VGKQPESNGQAATTPKTLDLIVEFGNTVLTLILIERDLHCIEALPDKRGSDRDSPIALTKKLAQKTRALGPTTARETAGLNCSIFKRAESSQAMLC
jgi:hypothetical protein